MVDLSGFYTATHDGVDGGAVPTLEEIRELAEESWGGAEAGYEFREVVAVGGMGAVLRVWDSRVERDVAMKVLLRPESPERVSRFFLEARLAAALEHPGIVSVHDVGLSPLEDPYFTMTLVQGGGLHRRIAAWAAASPPDLPPLRERIRMVRQLCDAIRYAHERGVCHLDIKPQNVMVGRFGEVVVIDWGVARLLGAASDRVAAPEVDGEVRGTPGFMAPEQVEGRTGDLNELTDVYALGALAYSVAVLKPPIVGDSVGELMTHSRSGAIVPPSTRGHVPVALSRIIMKAMSPEAVGRYVSVEAFAADLDAWLSGAAPSGVPLPALNRLGLFWSRNRSAGRIAVSAGVILVVGAVVLIMRLQVERDRAAVGQRAAVAAEGLAMQQLAVAEGARIDADVARRAAERSAYLAELRLAQQDLRGGRPADAALALLRCSPALRGWEWSWLMRVARQVDEGEPNLGESVSAVGVGGDVLLLQRDKLAVWPVGAGAVRSIPVPGSYRRVAVSADRKQVLLSGANGHFNLCSIADARSLWKTKAGPVGAVDAVPLGDGQHLVIAVGSRLQVWDMPAQRIVGGLSASASMVRCLLAVGDGRRVLAAGDDGVIRLWDVPARRVLRSYDAGVGALSALRLDGQLKQMAAVGTAGDVALVDLQGGRVAVVRPFLGALRDVAFSPLGDRLAILSLDGTCGVWTTQRRRFVDQRRLLAQGSPVCVVWRGDRVVAVDEAGRWYGWSLDDAAYSREERMFASSDVVLALDPQGGRLAVAEGVQLRVLPVGGRKGGAVSRAALSSPIVAIRHLPDSVVVVCTDGAVSSMSVHGGGVQALGRRALSGAVARAAVSPAGDSIVWVDRSGDGWAAAVGSDARARSAVAAVVGSDDFVFLDSGAFLVMHADTIEYYGGGAEGELGWKSPISGVFLAREDAGRISLLREVSGGGFELLVVGASSGDIISKLSLPKEVVSSCFVGDGRIATCDDRGVVTVSDFLGTPLCFVSQDDSGVGVLFGGGRSIVAIGSDGDLRTWSSDIEVFKDGE